MSTIEIQKKFEQWGNHRYFPISQYYKKHFGEKVYKVSVSIAESCPNRQQNSKMPLCIFCDEWGSAAYHLERDKSLEEQISVNRDKIAKRYHAKQFLVYFQSYTNTFDRFHQAGRILNVYRYQHRFVHAVLLLPDSLLLHHDLAAGSLTDDQKISAVPVLS